jgi:hypothetical protein
VNLVDEEDEYAFIVNEALDTGKMTVSVGGIQLEMVIDSGTSTNVIDKHLWEDLKKKHIKCTSKKTIKKLYSYGSTTSLMVIGTFTADVNVADRHVTAEFTVIDGKGEPLLGRKTAIELGVLKLKSPEQFVNNVTDRVARHKALFEGIGKLKGYKMKLHIDPQVRPVAQSVRRTAFSLRGKIEEKLDELLREDIIEKVDGLTHG